MSFTVEKTDSRLPAKAVLEVLLFFMFHIQVMVASDEVFENIGVEEKGVHYFCCDDQAFDVSLFLQPDTQDNQCNNHNRLWVRSPNKDGYRSDSVEFT